MSDTAISPTDIVMIDSCVRLLYYGPITETINALTPTYGDATLVYEESFSLSSDGVTWGAFMIKQDFISAANTTIASGMQIYMRYRINVKKGGVTGAMPKEWDSNISENGDTSNPGRLVFVGMYVNDILIACTSIEYPNAAAVVNAASGNMFNPYANLDAQMALWRDTCSKINEQFGHYVYYFRTVPDDTTKDAVFKQYRLFNVSELKKLKILLPGNRLPSGRNIYSEFNIQFTDELTMHVVHTAFEFAFGSGERPHTGDYMYLPLTGRMYEITTSTEIKQFMYKSTYSEIILIKYEDKDIVKETQEIAEQKLEYIEYLSAGGVDIQEVTEMQNVAPDYLDTGKTEYFRKNFNKKTEIVKFPLIFNNLYVFENMYLLDNVGIGNSSVEYDCKNTKDTAFSFSAWVAFEKLRNVTISDICDSNNNVICKLYLRNSFLNLNVNDTVIKTDEELLAEKRYAVIVNISSEYKFFSLTIVAYDESTQEATTHTDIFGAYNETGIIISNAKIYGGSYLISCIRILDSIIETDNAIACVTDTAPDMKDVKMYDKCIVPLASTRFTI
jgi:hypothetical protein